MEGCSFATSKSFGFCLHALILHGHGIFIYAYPSSLILLFPLSVSSTFPGPVSVSVKSSRSQDSLLVATLLEVSMSINSCSLGRGGPCERLSPAAFNCLYR